MSEKIWPIVSIIEFVMIVLMVAYYFYEKYYTEETTTLSDESMKKIKDSISSLNVEVILPKLKC